MANTITNFLVGIGFDYEGKGEKEAEAGLDRVKSKALQLGSVVAGAFGVGALTKGVASFADEVDKLGKFAQTYGVTAAEIVALQGALEHEGAGEGVALSALQQLETLRAQLLTGDAGFLSELGRAGIDPNTIINAENAFEAYKNLADIIGTMSGQQRINAVNALGFDDASNRLLAKGRDELEKAIAAELRMRTITDEQTKSTARFNDELQDLKTNLTGFSDIIYTELLDPINELLAGMNDLIDANREFIRENATLIGGVAAAGGGVLGAAGIVGGLGLLSGGIGAGAAAAGAVAVPAAGILAAGTGGALLGSTISDQLVGTTAGDFIGAGVAHLLALLGNQSAQESINAMNTPIQVQSTIKLDGQVLGRAVNDVIETNNRQTLNELQSNVEG